MSIHENPTANDAALEALGKGRVQFLKPRSKSTTILTFNSSVFISMKIRSRTMPVPAIIWKLICISTLSARKGAMKISASQDSLYVGPNKNTEILIQSMMKRALTQNIRVIITFENRL